MHTRKREGRWFHSCWRPEFNYSQQIRKSFLENSGVCVSASERPNEIWLGVRIGVQNSKGLSYLLEGSAVAKAAWWRTAKDNEGTVHSACATSVRAWALRDRHIAICPEFCCRPWVTVNRMADRRKSQVGKP